MAIPPGGMIATALRAIADAEHRRGLEDMFKGLPTEELERLKGLANTAKDAA
jgi:hypothetical protein